LDLHRAADDRGAVDLLQHRRLLVRAAALPGPEPAVHAPALDADDPAPDHADPAVRALPDARLGRHLPSADRAGLLRQPVLHLPDAAVRDDDPARPRRGGPDRRRLDLGRLRPDRDAALRAAAGGDRGALVPELLERVPDAADLHQQLRRLHDPARPELPARALQRRVEPDHGRLDPGRDPVRGDLLRRAEAPDRRDRQRRTEGMRVESLESMLYRREGAVAEIVLNRPERRNATDLQFYLDLLACLDR